MNVQLELARVGCGLHRLGCEMLDGEIGRIHAVMRLGELAEQVADIAEHLRPERPRLRGLRRWWFLATRRPIA